MRIIIQDHQHDKEGSWFSVLEQLAKNVGLPFEDLQDRNPDLAFLRQNHNRADNIVFLHSLQWQSWNNAQEDPVDTFNCILIHVGTHGFSGMAPPYRDRRFASRFTASEFRDTGRGADFFASLARGQPNWNLLNPVITETLFALRLLCEAWLLTHWSQASAYSEAHTLKGALRLEGDPTTLLQRIPLHAADRYNEWCGPFRVGPDAIASQMPDTMSQAGTSKFFKSINDQSPSFTQVAELLAALSVSFSPTGGTP